MSHHREIADAMHQDQLDAIEALRQEHGPRDDMESADVARAMVFVALCWAATAMIGYGIWEWVTG